MKKSQITLLLLLGLASACGKSSPSVPDAPSSPIGKWTYHYSVLFGNEQKNTFESDAGFIIPPTPEHKEIPDLEISQDWIIEKGSKRFRIEHHANLIRLAPELKFQRLTLEENDTLNWNDTEDTDHPALKNSLFKSFSNGVRFSSTEKGLVLIFHSKSSLPYRTLTQQKDLTKNEVESETRVYIRWVTPKPIADHSIIK